MKRGEEEEVEGRRQDKEDGVFHGCKGGDAMREKEERREGK